jgi:hypothetical protein
VLKINEYELKVNYFRACMKTKSSKIHLCGGRSG